MGLDQVVSGQSVPLPSASKDLALSNAMFDLITMMAAVNIQQELNEANTGKNANLQELVVNEHDSGNEGSLVEDAATSLSAVFDTFENTLGSLFGSTASSPSEPSALPPTRVKKV